MRDIWSYHTYAGTSNCFYPGSFFLSLFPHRLCNSCKTYQCGGLGFVGWGCKTLAQVCFLSMFVLVYAQRNNISSHAILAIYAVSNEAEESAAIRNVAVHLYCVSPIVFLYSPLTFPAKELNINCFEEKSSTCYRGD